MAYRRENLVAITVAAIVLWLFGAVWYGALSAPWLAATGRTLEQVHRYGAMPYIAALPLSWAACYGIANMLAYSPFHTPSNGVRVGLMLGTSIFAAMALMQILFEGRTWMLFVIDGGYGILGLGVAGGLIGWMKPGRKLREDAATPLATSAF